MKLPGMAAFAVLIWGSLPLPTPAFAHGGGLNAEGCHTNRKTGDERCFEHRGRDAAVTADHGDRRSQDPGRGTTEI